MTLFVVGKTTFVSGTAQSFIARSLYGVQDGRWAMIYETNYLFFITGGGGSGYTASATATPYSGTFSLFEGVWDGTSVYSYGNGTQLASVSASVTATSNSDLVLVGAYNNASGGVPPQTGFYYNGTIGEIIMFSNALSTGQRQQVEGYLAAKWGLLNTLPGKVSTPLSVSGCALWLDGADPAGTGTVPSNGATVSTWVDKSGNSANGTASGTPTYSSSSKAISFNGTNAFFSLPNGTITPGSTNFTIFVVCYPTNISGYPYVYGAGGSSADTGTALIFYPTGQIENGFYTDFMGIAPSGSVAINNLYLFTSFYDGSRTLYKNGTSVVSGTPSGTKNISTLNNRIGVSQGGGSFFYGTINEVIVFNTALSTTQRQSVENYLMSKWGISNVTSHPFKSIPPSTSQPPQFQEVTPGNWTRDWQPYLQRLAAANNPTNATVIPTLSYGAAAPGGNGGVLGPNNCVYAVSSTNLMIYNIATNTTSSVTLSTAAGQRGGVLAPNGYLYFGGDSNILIVNPSNNSYSYINFTYTGGQTTAGGVLAPNGNIYYSTYYAARSMVVNTSNNTVSSITLPGGQGWIGACLAPNGLIYAVPYGATTSVLVINPNTNTYSNITPSLTPALSTQNYTGCVLGPNGLIYGIPYSASNILIINPATNSVTYGTGGPSLSPALSTQTMYCGVLAPNGNIYGMPIGGASNILIINTFTNAVSWGTGGSSLSPALSTQGYASAVLAPNGNIYGIPGGASNMLIISNTYAQLPSSNCCLSAFLNKY